MSVRHTRHVPSGRDSCLNKVQGILTTTGSLRHYPVNPGRDRRSTHRGEGGRSLQSFVSEKKRKFYFTTLLLVTL